MMQGRWHWRSRFLPKTKLERLYQAKPGTQRMHALGDRALPDLMAAANAADPEEGFVRTSFKASFFSLCAKLRI